MASLQVPGLDGNATHTKRVSTLTSVRSPGILRTVSLLTSIDHSDAAFPALDIHRVPFTGGLHWDENGTLIRNPLPTGGTEWVGTPSPELDALWDHVVDAAGVDLIGHEADMVRGKTRQRPSGEYISGLDVFHQLHCLNKIRQSFYPDYYHDPDGKVIEQLHIGELQTSFC